VLNLMIRLQDERGLTYLFVTHDLDVARHISQRTAVLPVLTLLPGGRTVACHLHGPAAVPEPGPSAS
jgi:peptide/nickel transport system ATP-binding protein